jgi:ubiquinone/menaquinone biosynthesis C-methylase UbiE
LEVGCGTGVFSQYFRQKGLRVIGMDISEDMLAIARSKGIALQLLRGDAHCLPFPDRCFDITAAITTIEFTHDPDLVLQELFRVCKRIVVLGVLNKLSWMGLKRTLKGGTLFSQATFYNVGGLINLIRRSLGNVHITTKRPFRAFIAASITKQ